jgi:hypothetical protein
MMGRQGGDQSQLFYLFNLERLFRHAICCGIPIMSSGSIEGRPMSL